MRPLTGKMILIVALAVVVLALAGSLYIEFNGNPIALARTQAVVERYLHERYPNTKFAYVGTFYNMKFDMYSGRVISQGSIPVEFTVDHRWNKGLFFDDYLNRKLGAEAEALVEPIVRSYLPNATTEIWVDTSRFDSLPEDLSYDKGLGLMADLEINWNDSSLTKDGFVDAVLIISHQLKAAGFEFRGHKFLCRQEGKAAWSLSLDKEELSLSKEAILNGDKVSHWP